MASKLLYLSLLVNLSPARARAKDCRKGGREGGKEGGREGGREGGKEGGRGVFNGHMRVRDLEYLQQRSRQGKSQQPVQ